ncbi:putative disease resistance protein RGA3 [Medicago truncatula]|uniref:NBS-LRR type disease resistance protein n=1 Tax=Medicago truncatula TaxID=3880 RepID=A0A072VHJ6_MEDTR|nr:putative disease resistance protein RGA3 [Medicago truncatula]KEH41282.1 NBS-LRR type disease resistance protein [Medicago truncatula]
MIESFIFDIVDSLLGKLASYAYEQASPVYSLYEDLRSIKDTLSIVKGMLLDAEETKIQYHGFHEWRRQIQNICYDAEDVLEKFELQHKRKQVLKASCSNRMKVRHFFCSSNSLAFRLRMAKQIKDIRDRLDKVATDGTKFGLATINVDPRLIVQKREMTYPDVDALSVIGRESDREEIIKLLMQAHPHGDGDGDKSLSVIPMVGIGGLGKTTLAKLVFNDKRIDELFQLKMWVCVSDNFDIRQIIIKIINSAVNSASAHMSGLALQENIINLDIVQLVSLLKQTLSSQKFLLVLDDVWNDDRAKWIELKDLIKVGTRGSKIMVTTRNNSIASMMGNVPSYVLQGLSLKDCLSLFVKWAFKEGEEEKYPNLVEIGKEIVKKCQGVPLAVRTLGSSLFSKFDLNTWIFVRDSELWNLKQQKDDILPALKLSYDQMPSYLRQCFAYFSLYPKDITFCSLDIIALWVALGLVQPRNGSEKLEDIAREYIDELNSRSFLQDFEDNGWICVFKVHDLVHDLSLYVAKAEFLVVDSHIQNIPEQVRHLSIVENDSLGHTLFPKSRNVRSILFPIDGVGLDSESLLYKWISRYKFLRLLNLRYSSFEYLPNSIAKLEHMCFLDLSYSKKIKRLPNSICKLLNLQVLLLTGCTELEEMPKGLGKLISLRQLMITTKQSVLLDNEFASLNNLHTLGFHFCDNLKYLFSREQTQFTSLETLALHSCKSFDSLTLDNFPKLQNLFIRGCEKLNLSLKNDSAIQRLKMKHLYIWEFPSFLTLPRWVLSVADILETLVIYNFPNLEMLPECLTTMSHLKRLHIGNCPNLLNLPSDMLRLTTIEKLYIEGCPELCRKCQPQAGEYWPMIAHIKHVFIQEPRG